MFDTWTVKLQAGFTNEFAKNPTKVGSLTQLQSPEKHCLCLHTSLYTDAFVETADRIPTTGVTEAHLQR